SSHSPVNKKIRHWRRSSTSTNYFFDGPLAPASVSLPGPPGVATGSRFGVFSDFFLSPLPGPAAAASASLPGPPGVATAVRFGVFSDFFRSPLPGPCVPASASLPGPPGVATAVFLDSLFFFGSPFFPGRPCQPASSPPPGPPGVVTVVFRFGSSFFASCAQAPPTATDKQQATTNPVSFFMLPSLLGCGQYQFRALQSPFRHEPLNKLDP